MAKKIKYDNQEVVVDYAIKDGKGNQIDTTYQKAISDTNKLSSDLVDDVNQTHKFSTSEQLSKVDKLVYDSDGRISTSILPSYVDDVIDGYYHDGKFYKDQAYTEEIEGEGGKIYVDLPTNKTYRWSGVSFVEISSSLALGEITGTAYDGGKGKANADNIAGMIDGDVEVMHAVMADTASADGDGNNIKETYATKTELATKQDTLNATQLLAVNSGITEDKVAKYDEYESTIATKQDIVDGELDITIGDGLTLSDDGTLSATGVTSYDDLTNKPKVNNVELSGNKTLDDLGIQSTISDTNKLSSDLVDDTDKTNKFVTSEEKTTWNNKQSALSDEQLLAVNSGITEDKVSTYDGYSTSKQDTLTTSQLNAVNSGITDSKVTTYDGYASTIASKQNQLSTDQLNATNSGITSAKVNTYDGYATTIANKQDTLTQGTGISLSGNTVAIDTTGATSGQVLLKTDSGVAWTSYITAEDYTIG